MICRSDSGPRQLSSALVETGDGERFRIRCHVTQVDVTCMMDKESKFVDGLMDFSHRMLMRVDYNGGDVFILFPPFSNYYPYKVKAKILSWPDDWKRFRREPDEEG